MARRRGSFRAFSRQRSFHMTHELRLYTVADEYVDFLMTHDKRVFSNKEESRSFERKYLGTVLSVNQVNYFVPLASPKDSDFYYDEHGVKHIRRSIIPIIRITHRESGGNMSVLGTIKFSNMIPVLATELQQYDIHSEPDEQYRDLVQKQWAFIRRNKEKIYKHAQTIYSQKKKKTEGVGYLNSTVDFLLLEQKMEEYIR